MIVSLFFMECQKVIIVHKDVKKVQAEAYNYDTKQGDNVNGWAWNAAVGWISFNSGDCDADNDGYSDGNGNCPPNTVEIPDYGVGIATSTGFFYGYAWNEHLGWISFNEADAPPDNYAFNSDCSVTSPPCDNANSCTACYNFATKKVLGWAKILSMGEDGWIKFNAKNDDNYDVRIVNDPDATSSQMIGWAYNGNYDGHGIAWISFNCSNRNTCASDGGYDYKVSAYINRSPEITNMTAPNISYCSDVYNMAVLKWDYYDPDLDEEMAYQVKAWYDGSATPFLDTGKCIGNTGGDCKIDADANSYPLTGLTADKRVVWSVKVWDSNNLASEEYNSDDFGASFLVPKHNYPRVSFSYEPENPSIGQEVQFHDTTVYDGGVGASSTLWVFQNATPLQATSSDPRVIFVGGDESDDKLQVSLSITDDDGYTCSVASSSAITNIKVRLPSWIEVR